MRDKRGMTREDALALLEIFRLDREPPPPVDPEHVARRFVQVVFPDRRFYEEGPDRSGRGQ